VIDLKGVILAAGEGRRCRPLTQTRSKVMLPVGNRPIMEHVIAALAANGIQDLYIVVGYQKERIMDYFEDGLDFGVKITYLEQNELLGTAHALRKAEPYIDEASWWSMETTHRRSGCEGADFGRRGECDPCRTAPAHRRLRSSHGRAGAG